MLLCGQHKQCRLVLFHDSDFAGDLEDSKSTSGGILLHIRKSYICSNKFDVQETNCCFSQFNRIWNHLFGRWIEIRRAACSGVMGFDCFCFRKHDSDNRETGATHHHWQTQGKTNALNNIDCLPSNVQSSHQEALLYVFEDNEVVIKMIQRKESHNETCFQDPQSCAWLVVWSNLLGRKNPHQVHRHQKPTRWHSNQRKFHTRWVESFVVLVQYQPFQFYSVLWYNGETISTRFTGRKESQQHRDQWWILLQGRRRMYHPRPQKARIKEVMEVKIPGVQLPRKKSDRDQLISA